jgi:NAD-dependent deacetylase
VTQLHEIAGRLRRARRVTVLTGAGVSAASGVPTFRGAGGLWRARDSGGGGPQFRAEDLATARAFARDPRLVWDWYAWRRDAIAGCVPNAAHEVIAAWSRRWPFDTAQGRPGCQVVTQNVDDLHVRAGTRDLVRLHGSIWEMSCWRACRGPGHRWRDERVPLPDIPPACPACGDLARPAVVWFGESLDPADLEAADAAATCDVFLTVGTSAVVYPAAGFVHEARRRGAFTVEINPEATASSTVVDVAVHQPAETALPELESLIVRA